MPQLWSARHLDLHPNSECIFWTDEDPADYLRRWLPTIPARHVFPSDGWRFSMDDLCCPFCLETNLKGRKPMVEIIQTHRGPAIVCGSCGKVGPLVSTANGPHVLPSGKTGPR